jgi:hypothetical protein
MKAWIILSTLCAASALSHAQTWTWVDVQHYGKRYLIDLDDPKLRKTLTAYLGGALPEVPAWLVPPGAQLLPDARDPHLRTAGVGYLHMTSGRGSRELRNFFQGAFSTHHCTGVFWEVETKGGRFDFDGETAKDCKIANVGEVSVQFYPKEGVSQVFVTFRPKVQVEGPLTFLSFMRDPNGSVLDYVIVQDPSGRQFRTGGALITHDQCTKIRGRNSQDCRLPAAPKQPRR